MPKLKTHRGAAKRFKITAKGKIKRQKAYGSHIMTKKTAKKKRSLRKSDVISKHDKKRIAKLLPNS
jgi:large subunit ribosomal protein L35